VLLVIVLLSVSPARWTRCFPAHGHHHSHSSLDSGHSAWVSDLNRVLCIHIHLYSCSRSSRRRGRFIDSRPIFDLVFFCMTDLPICQPIIFVWFNAESILLFLHQQPDVAHLAAVYLKYASIGLPAYAFNCISRCALDPTEGNQLMSFPVDIFNHRVSLRSQHRLFSWLRLST